MKIEHLKRREGTVGNNRLTKAYDKMQNLIDALGNRDLPSDELISINERIQSINAFTGSEKELTKTLKNTYDDILKQIEKNLKLVSKHHFRQLWMVYGMLAGVVFSSLSSSFGIIGIGFSGGMGISIGMLIGIMIGANLDQQAEKNGAQLEV